MAHGAPDHTRLSDNAYAHYDYSRPVAGPWLVLPGDERSLYDLDLVGVFGLAVMLVDNKHALLNVEVDGISIFQDTPSNAFAVNGFYKGAVNGVLGTSIYDEVNDIYSLWFKSDWNIYVHTHLKIEVQNFTLNNCNVAQIRGYILTYK